MACSLCSCIYVTVSSSDRTTRDAADVAGDAGLIQPRIHGAYPRCSDAGARGPSRISHCSGLIDPWISRTRAGSPNSGVARGARLIHTGVSSRITGRAGLIHTPITGSYTAGKRC